MRITAEAKLATEQRILEAASRLFIADGWERTTTREIASAAGIATGTLFNYFQCKEAIAANLISDALADAQHEFEERAQRSGIAGGGTLLLHLDRSEAPSGLPQIRVACRRDDFQPAGAILSGAHRRFHPRQPPRGGRADRRRPRHPRAALRRDPAALLDLVPGRFCVLGRRRVAEPGRHPGAPRPIAEPVYRDR